MHGEFYFDILCPSQQFFSHIRTMQKKKGNLHLYTLFDLKSALAHKCYNPFKSSIVNPLLQVSIIQLLTSMR